MTRFAPAALVLAVLAGCTSTAAPEKPPVTGHTYQPGLLVSNTGAGDPKLEATGVGLLLGSSIGKLPGLELSAADRPLADEAAKKAYASVVGEKFTWKNPQSGNEGAILTIRQGYSTSNNYCREFQETVVVNNRTDLGYGTVCKQSDGAWTIVRPPKKA